MDVVVVDLERCVRSGSGEAHDVVVIVTDFDADLAEREIVRADVVHDEHVAFDLEGEQVVSVWRSLPRYLGLTISISM